MIRFLLHLFIAGLLLGLFTAGAIVAFMLPELPSVETLRSVELEVPLKIYTKNGSLIGEFGEQKRYPVALKEVPDRLVKAFLAAEDTEFYSHPGISPRGIARAVVSVLHKRKLSQGASTITMQVARNYFLTPEKSFVRKLKEMILALRIERMYSKDRILELYLNKIYFGQHAYGVAAASQTYYGVNMDQLNLSQMAVLASLPQRPSSKNPVNDPEGTRIRRNYVLERMEKYRFITQAEFEAALREPVAVSTHHAKMDVEIEAPHIAEMVRTELLRRYGAEVYASGVKVYTTIDDGLQLAANRAAHHALAAYDRRHGYRGPEAHHEISDHPGPEELEGILASYPVLDRLDPAVITEVENQVVHFYTRDIGYGKIAWEGLSWARPYIDANTRGPPPTSAKRFLRRGDIIRIEEREPAADEEAKGEDGEPAGAKAKGAPKGIQWRLAQLVKIEGVLVSMDPHDGALLALVGGSDFAKSKFNRAVQALRQPGSNFKPFIYSAGLDAGFTAATVISDSPFTYVNPETGVVWQPENYSRKYAGPTRLRVGLKTSRNLVAIKLLDAIGVERAIRYVQRFGFEKRGLPHGLSLALGSGEVTPLGLVSAYAVLANGGFRVEPYFITRIETADGNVLMKANPATVCKDCQPETVEPMPEDKEEAEPLPDPEVIDLSRPNPLATKPPPPPPSEADMDPTAPRHAPRVVDAENIWVMTSMMQDTIRSGTATKALVLKRDDLAGKTGTTNDQKDAWFSGFNSRIVTTCWVGFDNSTSLGKAETGAMAALPMWIEYMRFALDGMPESLMEKPEGILTLRIEPGSGNPVSSGGIVEDFMSNHPPKRFVSRFDHGAAPDDGQADGGGYAPDGQAPAPLPEDLF
jgi:penicillin-binding protein 1A